MVKYYILSKLNGRWLKSRLKLSREAINGRQGKKTLTGPSSLKRSVGRSNIMMIRRHNGRSLKAGGAAPWPCPADPASFLKVWSSDTRRSQPAGPCDLPSPWPARSLGSS